MNVSGHSASDKMRNLRIPLVSEDLAELVGIHIGDGHLGSRIDRNEFLFQITGHSINDKEYYEGFVIPLIKGLFNIEPRKRFKKSERTLEIRVFSKGVFNFLVRTFDLPIGKKKDIRIPRAFFASDALLKACLRGIIDTDFFLSLDKKHMFLGACFGEKSLVEDTAEALQQLGISTKTYYDRGYTDTRTGKYYNMHKIRISTQKGIDSWHRLIGSHHPIIISRYKQWKALTIPKHLKS